MQPNYYDQQNFKDDNYGGYGSNGGYGGFAGYVAEPVANKGVWVSLPKKRLNVVPMIVCLLVPWALFVTVYSVMAFSFHYTQPLISEVVALALLGGVVAVAIKSATGRFRLFRGPTSEREPSWLIFFSLSLLLAWVLGFLQGSSNYSSNTGSYYDLLNLNNYTNVFPNRMLGQQLMDAGIVSFAPGSQLDIKKSMGFKNQHMYCVAPIVFGSQEPASYDFWAVGKDCCSGYQADFACRNYNNPQAGGGIRMMSGDDRAYYRLAVQQAEALYGYKASHPLFFTWEVDPANTVLSWYEKGKSSFISWIVSYLVLQLCLVTLASIIFAKLGNI